MIDPMDSADRPVTIEEVAPSELVGAIVKELESAGCEAEIADRYVPKGSAAHWLIEIGIKDTIEGFFLAVGAAGFTKLVRTVFESEKEPEKGRLEVVDRDGTRLTLSSALPDEAVSALGDMDWSNIRGGSLTWVADRRVWESAG